MMTIDRRSFVHGCAAAGVASVLPARAFATAEAPPVAFADGSSAPPLGIGSWHMASPGAAPEAESVAAMRLGISLGMTLIDTAELYSAGRAEEMVAKAIAGQRDKVFLVSKVMPEHASEDGIEHSLRASLQRLGTDHLDLYLLHWRESRTQRLLDALMFREGDLKSAVRGFERARQSGLIKRWGVSNFTVNDMEQLFALPDGDHCATNQVIYNLRKRGAESDVIPWCDKHKMPIMAYSPLGAGGKASLLSSPVLKSLGAARGVSPAAIALAWAMRNGRTMVVTETGSEKHVREDAAALTLSLSAAELKTLDDAFPVPRPS